MAKFREIIVKSIDVQSGTYLNIVDETKNITALDIYLVPKEDGEHERYVVDNNGLTSKQSAGVVGNFIPMEGIKPNNGERISGVLYQSDVAINDGDTGTYRIYSGAPYNGYVQKTQSNINVGGVLFDAENTFTTSGKRHSSAVSKENGDYSILYTQSMVHDVGSANYQVNLHNYVGGQSVNGQFQMTDEGVVMNFSNSTVDTGFTLESSGFKISGITNAQGDSTFTRQLVQKENGLIGYEPKNSSKPTLYPKVDIVEYSEDETHYLMKITVSNVDDSTYGTSDTGIFNVSTGGTSALIDAIDVDATFIGSTEYASSPAPSIGQYNRIWGYSFNVKFPKNSNTHPFWKEDNRAITVVFKGRDIADGQGNSPYKPRRYGSDTKLIKLVKPNLKKIDNTIPNGVGDATYTRQLVQKTDGTIGWVARPLVLKGNQFIREGGYTADYNIAESFTNNNIKHTGIGDTSNPITVRVHPGAPNYSETKGYWIFTVNQIVVTMEGACPTCYQQVVYKDGTGAPLISGTKILIAAGSAIFVVSGIMYIK